MRCCFLLEQFFRVLLDPQQIIAIVQMGVNFHHNLQANPNRNEAINQIFNVVTHFVDREEGHVEEQKNHQNQTDKIERTLFVVRSQHIQPRNAGHVVWHYENVVVKLQRILVRVAKHLQLANFSEIIHDVGETSYLRLVQTEKWFNILLRNSIE